MAKSEKMTSELDKPEKTSQNGENLENENLNSGNVSSPGGRIRKILSETEPEEAGLPEYPIVPLEESNSNQKEGEGTPLSFSQETTLKNEKLTSSIEKPNELTGDKDTDELPEKIASDHPLDLNADFWEEKPNIEDTPVNLHNEVTIPPAGEPIKSMVLPHYVEATDSDATRVTPAAYGNGPSSAGKTGYSSNGLPPRRGVTPPVQAQYSGTSQPQQPVQVKRNPPAEKQKPVYRPAPQSVRQERRTSIPPAKQKKKRKPFSCFVQMLIICFFIFIGVLLAGVSYGVFRYYQVAATLPDVATLRERSSHFETTRILDRNGNLLYEMLDPTAGRRTYVTLDQISPNVIAATLATEDKDFYNNPGFDPVGIVRALWQNYTSGEVVSGASTITQQLARLVLMTQEERYEISANRKAREIILAAEITRRYTKDEILELYLNEIYYSNLSYGIQAAAETYFNTSAAELTVGQAAFLAGLPQGPGIYDIFTNREATLARSKQILVLMYTLSQERNCIAIPSNDTKVCLDAAGAAQAAEEIDKYPFKQADNAIKFPHWVFYIQSLLEAQYDSQTIYRSGFTVYTTLDPDLQEFAQQTVTNQVNSLVGNHATDGALVAIKPSTGEILAMVGSADFYNEAISGQVNMAISPRQPGSSIKPLTYAAAFEKGWTPSTLIWDVPTDFPPSGDPSDTRPPYQPVNYDGRFNGPVTVRTALANSLNIPAVKTLQYIGIYDDPSTTQADGFINFAKRMGISTLTRDDYGLSLTLGGGDVSLMELTSAFGIFANSGVRMAPVAILRILDSKGNEVYAYKSPQGEQVIRTEHAYLINDILSDNNARAMIFGANSVLNLPFRVAAKTGTTNDFRDNWTLGYTPDLVVGVWVGNADYTPMQNTTGMTGAAPIWSEFMQYAITKLTGGIPTAFYRPNTIVDRVICSISGAEPSEWCPEQRGESFAIDQLPLPKEDDLWQKINVDTWTGLLASPYCSDYTEEKLAINVTDPYAIRWIRETSDGTSWAERQGFEQPFFFRPDRECKDTDARPHIEFAGISNGQTIETSPLDIYAIIDASENFARYRLEAGYGEDPSDWKVLKEGNTTFDQPELIYTWDLMKLAKDTVTIRIYVESTVGTYAEKRITLKLKLPTPTPTETALPTMTPTETLTPTMTIAPPEETATPEPPTDTPESQPTH
jgi:penicillin-binding protein 1C